MSRLHPLSRHLGAALALAVLASGLAMSWALSSGISSTQQARVADVTAQRAKAVEAAVIAETQRYVNTLENLTVATGAQSDLHFKDFLSMTDRLGGERLPGATSAVYVAPASVDGIAEVESTWRDQGVDELMLRPEGVRSEHKFIVMARSLDRQISPPGRDVTSHPEINAALDLSRETGNIVASSTYVLPKDRGLPPDQQPLSFVLVAPIYGSGASPDVGAFRGWLMMELRGQGFMNATLRRVSEGMVNVTLSDRSAAGMQTSVASFRDGSSLETGEFDRERLITVGGKTWQLSLHPTHGVLAGISTRQDEQALSGGATISILLALLVWLLFRSRDRALWEVERATEQLRADIRRREAVEEELRAREAELSAFAGVVAHDLKSPLTSILGYTELLQDSIEKLGDSALTPYLQRVHNGGLRMRSLIDDLLNYATAKETCLELQPVDLGSLVREVIAERGPQFADFAPVFDVQELPVVHADERMLHQLLDNLIGNALKYVQPGRAANVAISASMQDGGWRIMVADHGIGVPPGQRDEIFATFRRAKGSEDYSGTGLGLAICQRIVERHHGEIGVEDNEGGGSLFWFTLPDDVAVRQERRLTLSGSMA